MAMIARLPDANNRPKTAEPADDSSDLEWYQNIETWDFESQKAQTMRPARMLATVPVRPASAPSVLIDADATFKQTEDVWKLLNQLERDVALDVSTRPTTQMRRTSSRSRRRLPAVVPEIERLEGALKEHSREGAMTEVGSVGPSRDDVQRRVFVVDCKTVILDLEDDYTEATAVDFLMALERVNTLMLQFRDVIDPFVCCLICAEALRCSEFPKRVTSACNHFVSTCFACLKNWVASSLEDRGIAHLKCIECNGILHGDDVRAIASPETFQRYDELSARKVLHDMPDFYFCLNPKCKSGQVHYGGAKFECHVCKNRICAKHGVAWHEAETCTEYDLRRADANKEYDAAEDLKVRIARACPMCNAPIEKNGGCGHMNCWKCDGHFNWDDAPAYFPKAFVWDRDHEKLSEVIQSMRKRSLPVRIIRRLFPKRKLPVRPPRRVRVNHASTLEDGCFD